MHSSRPALWHSRSREYRQTLNGRFSEWRKSAKEREIGWNLKIEQLAALPKICFYTNRELTMNKGQFNTISLERIDSNKSYNINNVVFCCAVVNFMKLDYGVNEFLETCSAIHKNKKRILDRVLRRKKC